MMAAQPLRSATSASGLNHIDELLDKGGMHLVELPGYNRGLVAAKDLPQGSLLLRETPLLCARAPQHAGKARQPSTDMSWWHDCSVQRGSVLRICDTLMPCADTRVGKLASGSSSGLPAAGVRRVLESVPHGVCATDALRDHAYILQPAVQRRGSQLQPPAPPAAGPRPDAAAERHVRRARGALSAAHRSPGLSAATGRGRRRAADSAGVSAMPVKHLHVISVVTKRL